MCLEEELSWPRAHQGQRSCNDSILISSMTNNDARGAEAVSEREDRQLGKKIIGVQITEGVWIMGYTLGGGHDLICYKSSPGLPCCTYSVARKLNEDTSA